MSISNPGPPSPSAVSTFISKSGAKSASDALTLEVMHNLQHQHNWTDLKRHLVYLSTLSPLGLVDLDRRVRTASSLTGSGSGSGTSSPSPSSSGTATPAGTGAGTITIISGLPPQHSYIHPDLQAQLLKQGISESTLPVQREFVLPLSLGEKWSLARFCTVFDQLPEREMITLQASRPDAAGRRRGSGSNGHADAGPAPGPTKSGIYEHRDQKRMLLGMKAREGVGGDGTVVYYIMQEGDVKPRQNG